MERNKIITRATNEFLENNVLESFPIILEEILKNNDFYMKEIMLAFEQLFQKGIKYQKENKKGSIAFVGISFLHNSFLNETFEFEIELYDENYLADKNPVIWNYVPSFMAKYYKDDWTSYQEYMKSKISKLRKNETYPFRLILADKYKKIMERFFVQIIPYIMRLLSYRDLIKSDDVKILYGDYYGKCIQIN